MSYRVVLPRVGRVAVWRAEARKLLGAGVPPDGMIWQQAGQQEDLFAAPNPELPPSDGQPLKASRVAISTIERALLHSDPGTYARAYDILWRMREGTLRFGDRADKAMHRLLAQAKHVARDIHKMHAFVRFRELERIGERRRFAAWFEPEHEIVEAGTPFFAKRFGDMDWTICTPGLTATFVAGDLSFSETVEKDVPPADATEDLWRTYYASIFNPARLMTKAMCAEMPKKYWKNLPEAELIPDLIASAQERSRAMQAAAPTLAPARVAAVQKAAGLDQVAEMGGDARAQVQACQRCPLGARATQAVWGEGPQDAAVMLVGEQPGDQEDLQGRPFVGPAGKVLDQALEIAGVDREALYLTNAVKHFKYKPRGKRRIHQRPDVAEIEACQGWLAHEVATVRPRLVVALGATATRALTGNGSDLMKRRGRVETGLQGQPVFITVHPSSILRQGAPQERGALVAALAADLARAMQEAFPGRAEPMPAQSQIAAP